MRFGIIDFWKSILKQPMTSKQCFRTFFRIFVWQMRMSLAKKPLIFHWINDTKLLISKGMHGATGNLYYGLSDFSDMSFVLHFLRKGDDFLDIGANMGTYTVLASGVVGARTICFEPLPQTHDQLLNNIRINKLETLVQAENIGLGNKIGTVRFTSSLGPMNRVVGAEFTGSTVEIPITTLDSFNELNATMWKVDIEGYEDAFFEGAINALSSSKLKAILIETVTEKIRSELVKHGFKQRSYNAFQHKLEDMASMESINSLWIRDEEFVNSRLNSATKFSVYGLWI